MDKQGKLITIAIHTYEKAVILKTLLEKEGITAVLHNVNLIQPVVSSGVRVRIHEEDLPLTLKIIESSSILKQGGDEALGNTVFIPVDFSEYSAKACFIGFDLAYRLGGDVVLFHTFLDQKYAGIFPLDSDEYETDSKEVSSRAEVEHHGVCQHPHYHSCGGERRRGDRQTFGLHNELLCGKKRPFPTRPMFFNAIISPARKMSNVTTTKSA